jgi:hypothetical protein
MATGKYRRRVALPRTLEDHVDATTCIIWPAIALTASNPTVRSRTISYVAERSSVQFAPGLMGPGAHRRLARTGRTRSLSISTGTSVDDPPLPMPPLQLERSASLQSGAEARL